MLRVTAEQKIEPMLEGIGMNSKSTFINKQSSLVYEYRVVELTGFLSGVNLIIPSVRVCVPKGG